MRLVRSVGMMGGPSHDDSLFASYLEISTIVFRSDCRFGFYAKNATKHAIADMMARPASLAVQVDAFGAVGREEDTMTHCLHHISKFPQSFFDLIADSDSTRKMQQNTLSLT